MEITFDPAKRLVTLRERGLDFARTPEVFAAAVTTFRDERMDYREARSITVGMLDGRMVVGVWTERDHTRRMISMRKANDREQARYRERG
ncbi:BrnT family toxin [Methylobacterium sp. WL6]|uniref:BrnT family toxin n=1 Tax=Methylobacterium sp. WL6 TaxID=2603901 RepID=UPI0011CA1942|nr:BrnT family toxin [Methylobacterium sp. WL6]TXN68771.1 BrnT family toxin [Methylobacterium sp. WL6]